LSFPASSGWFALQGVFFVARAVLVFALQLCVSLEGRFNLLIGRGLFLGSPSRRRGGNEREDADSDEKSFHWWLLEPVGSLVNECIPSRGDEVSRLQYGWVIRKGASVTAGQLDVVGFHQSRFVDKVEEDAKDAKRLSDLKIEAIALHDLGCVFIIETIGHSQVSVMGRKSHRYGLAHVTLESTTGIADFFH
jgi:hypothetical protein